MVEEFIYYFETLLENNNIIIVTILASLMVILESIIPILPLSVIISLNMLVFGPLMGFVISWVSTIIGCIISFYFFRYSYDRFFYKYIKKPKFINKIDNIKFKNLVLITALPFSPAFAINIASGISKMKFKKFLTNIVISKIVVVIFWGYIGTSIIDSLTNIDDIITLGIILLIAYYLSDYIMKKFNL